MKWLKQHIKTISLIWFLMHGILLLINEIRVYFEHNYLMYSFLIVSICLIVVSLLLFVKNKKIFVALRVLLLLYSIISIGFIFLLLLNWGIHLAHWLFLLIPIINVFLSMLLLLKKSK